MLTKETPAEIKALYDEFMSIFVPSTLFHVFPGETTIVVDRQPETDAYDMWFYRFKESPERVAILTAQGQQLQVTSVAFMENIKALLAIMPAVLIEQRNRLCELETGVPYKVATGQETLPVTAHRKPMRERRH